MLGWGDHFKALQLLYVRSFSNVQQIQNGLDGTDHFLSDRPFTRFFLHLENTCVKEIQHKTQSLEICSIVIGVLTLLVLIPVFDPNGPRDEQLMSPTGRIGHCRTGQCRTCRPGVYDQNGWTAHTGLHRPECRSYMVVSERQRKAIAAVLGNRFTECDRSVDCQQHLPECRQLRFT